MYLEGPFDKVWLKKDSVALAVQNKQLPFPAHDKYPPALRELVCGLVGLEPSERPNIRWTINEVESLLPNHLVHV
uniref:non-specific serine/threonine protein kinase n=1 Tax=Ciona savignyi TaxID=51511 RepID=H2YRJ2_CIOSA